MSQKEVRDKLVSRMRFSHCGILGELGHTVGRREKFWVDFLYLLVPFLHVKRRKGRSEEKEG